MANSFQEHSRNGDIGNGDVKALHDPGIGDGLVETAPQALNAKHYVKEVKNVSNATSLTIKMAPGGGFAARIY